MGVPGAAGDDAAWLGLSSLFYVPIAVGSAGWIAWRSGGAALVDRVVGDQPLVWLVVGLVAGAALAGVSQVLAKVIPALAGLSDGLAAQLGPLTPATTLALAGLSSVGEELLFRGVLQPAWGIPAATLLFAAVHVPLDRAMWVWPIAAGAVGLGIALLAESSGGLVGPIAVHFAVNAINLRWMARRAHELRTPP